MIWEIAHFSLSLVLTNPVFSNSNYTRKTIFFECNNLSLLSNIKTSTPSTIKPLVHSTSTVYIVQTRSFVVLSKTKNGRLHIFFCIHFSRWLCLTSIVYTMYNKTLNTWYLWFMIYDYNHYNCSRWQCTIF